MELLDVLKVAFGGGVGAALTKGLEVIATRGRSKAYVMGAVDHAVETAMSSVTGQLERTEDRLVRIEAQHEDCERNLQGVRNDLADEQRQRAELQDNIDRLLQGPVALVGQQPPK